MNSNSSRLNACLTPLIFITFLGFVLPSSAALISIGVLNTRDSDEDSAFWQASANHLAKKIPEHQFVIKPLGLECLTHAINKRQLDYVITHPAQVVDLQKTAHVHPMATMQTHYKGHSYSHFSAAIIARAERDDLNHLSDLKNQSMIAVSPTEFGGYQMIWRELLKANITPKNDLFDLRFTNGTQANIVNAILNEEADIGIIRSGLLEIMLAKGQLQPDQLKIIHAQHPTEHTPLHSTILYANWTWVRLDHSDIALSRKMASILHRMPKKQGVDANHYEAHYGWTFPEDLTTVHGLLRALELAPYEPSEGITFQQLIKQYGIEIGLILALLSVLMVATLFVSRTNRKLAQSQSELARHRDNLEQEVAERTQELSQVNHALEKDIKARETVEATLRRSRTALQGFYEITINRDQTQPQKLQQLIQLARQHFTMDAAFLFNITKNEQNPVVLCTSDGDKSYEANIINCLQTNQLNIHHGNLDAIHSSCSDRLLCHLINVHSLPHCLLCFIGQRPTEVPEVDQELLRLITQWIGASIERQTIEEDRTKYQSQLSKVTRLFTVGEMASGLAHEINQPLTAATNYISGSLRRLQENNPKSVETGLNRSLESLDRATAIIRRLREFVQTGVPNKDVFDLVKVTQRVLDLLEREANQQNILLLSPNAPNPVKVTADKVQIEQVMLNLVRNAIEATPKDGQVAVTLTANHNKVTVCVIDTGEGVNEFERESIFDAFHSSKSDGMGLGLAICRSIVEAHSSRLTVINTSLGAEFSFTLPQYHPISPTSPTSPTTNSRERSTHL